MAIVGSCFRSRWFGSFVKSPNSKTRIRLLQIHLLCMVSMCGKDKLAAAYCEKVEIDARLLCKEINFAFARDNNHNSLLYNQKLKVYSPIASIASDSHGKLG
ncbi:hypothetical protein T4D_1662 [Trichinella pseudospiralis]|uniref:Uncharacterized protein n=1 Tax=Trichinella pseudospiralis TaxID=6337 RepID=A0A0V1G701_TRIPS|nr:hypothetical protein T4D_1662 [Trichinella pseudospiralis]